MAKAKFHQIFQTEVVVFSPSIIVFSIGSVQRMMSPILGAHGLDPLAKRVEQYRAQASNFDVPRAALRGQAGICASTRYPSV
jgi:hypothetical protein